MSQVPSISVTGMPLQELGKGAAQPLLFGGNRTTKSVEQQVSGMNKPQQGAAAAASGAKQARKEGLTAEQIAKKNAEFEATRQAVQKQVENVKSLKGSAPAQGAQEIFVNNFPIKAEFKNEIYQYQVTCEPEIPNRKTRKNVVEKALNQLNQKYDTNAITSNNIVYTQRPIHNTKQDKNKETVNITLREKPHAIDFRFTRAIDTSKGLSTETYGVLATVLREAFDSAGMVKIAGKYFDVTNKYSQRIQVEGNLPEALAIASGLNITLYPTGRGLMLNVDLSMRVTRTDTCLATIKNCKAYAEKMGDDWREVVRAELVGSVASTTYSLNQRKQTFNIAEVRFDANPKSLVPGFATKQTFKEYMKEHHNIEVKDENQPLLLFRSQREIDREGKPVERWYIPELCQLVGQSTKMRGDASLQQDLKRACLLTPQERFGYICSFMNKICSNTAFQGLLNKWSMAITPNITKVPLKQLRMPQITLRGNENQRAWQVDRIHQKPTTNITTWGVISPDRLDSNALNAFLGSLNNDLRKYGINLPAPQFYQYRSDRDPGRWGRNLVSTLDTCDENMQFCLVVLNDNSESNYFQVKETSLKDWSIPSQCVLQKNANCQDQRKLGNITSRIAGQIVVKLGGALWATTQPVANTAGAVVIGMSTEAGKGGTALAMVAHRASDNVPFGAVCATFTGNAEAAIVDCLKRILAAYKQDAANRGQQQTTPKTFVVYRPGMNEGDVPKIITEEVIPVQTFCAKEKIELVFLNSLKRCTIRFHPAPPGALVDDFITPTTGFTFYCVPQVCNQGCATAMKFSVLSNSAPANITADVIENLTFNQCHMFYGWWGATREPACVMYSERLATFHAKTDVRKAAPNTTTVRTL